jgi:glucose-1-phosphate thymidylyltransferase
MKGIILAGGNGTRLYPLTQSVNKHLLNLYDKPVIYYPLSTLMSLGIKDILLITQSDNVKQFEKILGDGSKFGIKISYAVQNKPNGLAEAFVIGEKFIGKDTVSLILGDNVFITDGFTNTLKQKLKLFKSGGVILAMKSKHPQDFGVIVFDKNFNVIEIDENPKHPKSNYIVPGLYFFDSQCIKFAKAIEFSKRNEKEITDVINRYLELSKMQTIIVPKNVTWSDVGTVDGIHKMANYISSISKTHQTLVGSPELVAWNNG